MAWSTPLTAVANAALTAAQWNASVRDNLLTTFPALASAAGQIAVSTGANTIAARTPNTASVATAQSTTSLSYVDLATAGPAVTLTTGAKVLVGIRAHHSQSSGSGFSYVSYAVSGATTLAASDDWGTQSADTAGVKISIVSMQTGLTPGSNTFTAKYRAGTTGTASFQQRFIWVLPLS